MNITDKVSSRICELIQNYISEVTNDPPEVRQLVIQQNVLPLIWGIGGVYTIHPNGDIISFPWDDNSQGQIELDQRIRNLALFQGSKKYGELESLIEKPENARVCPHCGGTGIDPYAEKLNTDAIVCYCGGLGWIP
jgi:hypothetical protein